MADEKGGGGAKLWGPFKTPPQENSLGAEKVSGVPGPKDPPDPLGLKHGV